MCQMLRFIRVEVGFGIKKRKMLLLASLYVFITKCNKLYFQYSCHGVIQCVSDLHRPVLKPLYLFKHLQWFKTNLVHLLSSVLLWYFSAIL